jgi:hypothetical protein
VRPRQRRIVAGPEGAAVAIEVAVAAEDPVAGLDAQRRRTVVEAGIGEVGDDLRVDRERPPGQVRALEQDRAGSIGGRSAATSDFPARDDARRTYLAVEAAEIGVSSGRKRGAGARILAVLADLPRSLVDDRRARAVVDAERIEIRRVAVEGDRPAAEIRQVEQDDAAADRPGGRHAVLEPHAAQRRVVAGREAYAAAAEIGVAADLPRTAADRQRLRAVVEADVLEVLDRAVGRE